MNRGVDGGGDKAHCKYDDEFGLGEAVGGTNGFEGAVDEGDEQDKRKNQAKGHEVTGQVGGPEEVFGIGGRKVDESCKP